MLRCLVAIVVGLLAAFPAYAKDACYSSDEVRAEQLLRLHSKLMVVTVTCRYASTGQELTPMYTSFTQKYLSEIKQAEAVMTAFYKKNYKGNAQDRLDKLRTLLGNEYGQKIADVSAPAFCTRERDYVPALLNASPVSVASEGERLAFAANAYAPVCAEKIAARKK
jgi:hypothetical protein